MATDWGAVSSWVAASISVTAFGAGTVRAWWNRPQVDWALGGELRMPRHPHSDWLEGALTISNFGDGPAHRVSIHIQRGGRPPIQVVATAALVKPGDSFEFFTGVMLYEFESTHMWASWTPPPIRRRRERTSAKLLIADTVTLSDLAKGELERLKQATSEELK
jgi:hypothetical protein